MPPGFVLSVEQSNAAADFFREPGFKRGEARVSQVLYMPLFEKALLTLQMSGPHRPVLQFPRTMPAYTGRSPPIYRGNNSYAQNFLLVVGVERASSFYALLLRDPVRQKILLHDQSDLPRHGILVDVLHSPGAHDLRYLSR